MQNQQTPDYKIIVNYNVDSEHAFQQFEDYIRQNYPGVEIIGSKVLAKSLGLDITIQNRNGTDKTVFSVQTKGDIIPNQEQQFRFIDKFMKTAARSSRIPLTHFTQKSLGTQSQGQIQGQNQTLFQSQEQNQEPRLYTEEEMEQNRQKFGDNPALLNKNKNQGKNQKLPKPKRKPAELWGAHAEKLKEYEIVMHYNIESKDIYQDVEEYIRQNYPGVDVIGKKIPFGTLAIDITIEKKDGSEMSHYAVQRHEDYVYDKEELVEFVDNFMKHAAQTARLPMYEDKQKVGGMEIGESKMKMQQQQQQNVMFQQMNSQ